MTCKYCGKEFEPSHGKQVYCSRVCAARGLRPWEKAVERRKEAVKERRRELIETTPKEELEKAGYAKGYQAARYKYHYRTFLRQLSALLAADASGVAVPSDTR